MVTKKEIGDMVFQIIREKCVSDMAAFRASEDVAIYIVDKILPAALSANEDIIFNNWKDAENN
jgi:hypothetical protein